MKPEIDLVSVLTELLRRQPDVLALFLVGSYADQTEDSRSDLDALVIVADGAFSTYSASLDWLRPVGAWLAYETVAIENGRAILVRLCLDTFQQFDLAVAPEALLKQSNGWLWLETKPVRGVFSRSASFSWLVPDRVERKTSPAAQLSVEAFQSLVNRFWFRQTQIARKVIRGDLLVALHLCLMALEDCCVLAMLLRDRSTGTSVHKDGGVGNELVVQIQAALRNGSRERILECATSAGDVFEQFAKSWSADYKARCPEFREWISRPI